MKLEVWNLEQGSCMLKTFGIQCDGAGCDNTAWEDGRRLARCSGFRNVMGRSGINIHIIL